MTEFIADSEEEILEGLASGKIEKLDGFDYHAGRHWIYPINREIRDYQYCIVHQALFNNTLVVLPTGLGKTLIAAVVIYNLYLWYPQSKIVFMAPTRPLVKQQMEACFDIVGIPKKDIVELTGHTPPFKRQEEWSSKRLFFLTPQVMQNDLFLNDYCPAEKIKCIVVDEAHKATGGYAYTRVIEEVYKRNSSFRVLALSATPGKDLIHIKQVLKNLLISKIEYRSEESLDVQKYTHHRRVETIVVQLDEELSYYRDRLLTIIEENLQTLVKRKAIGNYDLNRLSSYYLLMQKKNYEAGQHNIPVGLLNSIRFTFAITTSLVYALDLLKNHGLRSFYNHVKGSKSDHSPGGSEKSKKGFNLGNILKKNTILQEILEDLKKKFEPDGNVSFNGDLHGDTVHSVPGHPKLVKLQEIVVNHFEKEGDDTRIMIFSQYRDSVEEITCLLRQHSPKVRPVQFVGQSSVKRRGFSQKQQLEVIGRFRDGEFNVLIATCVAEEGLDIGNVDLIICYDANKSPIRLVQRMGRTGRAREGKIIILTTAGKEEEAHNDSIYNRKRVATNILSNIKQEDLFSENVRLYPKGLKPNCRKLYLGIRKEKTCENDGDQDCDGGSEGEMENDNANKMSSKKKPVSAKRKRTDSATKESTCKKRNSLTKRNSNGASTIKKRKNRFIFQNDEVSDTIEPTNDIDDNEKNDNHSNVATLNLDALFSDEDLVEPKSPEAEDLFDENDLINELNRSPNEKSPESTLMEYVDRPEEAEKVEKVELEDPFDEFECSAEKSPKFEEPNEAIEEESKAPSNSFESSLEKEKSSATENLGSFSFTQNRNKSPSPDEISPQLPKSVPVKKSKWSEFLSSDDSYDSLDYNPLQNSPKSTN